MRYLAVPACLFALTLAVGAVPAPAEKKASENLDGVWVCTVAEKGDVQGPDLVGKLKFTFAGAKMRIDGPRGKLDAKVTLDFAKRPCWLDFQAESGKDKEIDDHRGFALFQRDGDTLKICLDNRPGSPRPTEMKASGSIVVLTLKLQK